MKTSFESLLEKLIPEINFLTVASAGVRPGHVLESLDKDIIAGYLPEFIKDVPIMAGKDFETIEEPYSINLGKTEGTNSNEAALKVMKFLGLKFNRNINYKIDFNIKEIRSVRFKDNLDKITFELALDQLKKNGGHDKLVFKKFKGHILVLRVLYATEFEVTVAVDKGNGFESDVNLENVEVEAGLNYIKKENTVLISQGANVPFGVIGYKIKQ